MLPDRVKDKLESEVNMIIHTSACLIVKYMEQGLSYDEAMTRATEETKDDEPDYYALQKRMRLQVIQGGK